jgi:hypothetical protein
MGKMALLLVLGFGITLAMATRVITGRLSEAVENSSSYYNKTRAKNIASSTVEIFVRKLKTGDFHPGQDQTKSIRGGSAEVIVTDIDKSSAAKPDTLKMVTISNFQGLTDTIVNILTGNLSSPALPINGALSVSGGSKLNLANGTNDTVSGYNHDLYGNLSSTCSGVHGLVYGQWGDVTSTTLNNQVKGVGAYTPDTFRVDGQPDYQSLIDQLVLMADTVMDSSPPSSPSLTLGTLSNPRITVVNGGLTFQPPTTGAGILIIKPGNGTWQTSRTFSWTGLIFVVGDGTKAQVKFGREASIIGGMVMSGTQVKIDMNAGSYVQTIEYSCEAIGMAFALGQIVGNYVICDWWE